jgi:hypothetical protein
LKRTGGNIPSAENCHNRSYLSSSCQSSDASTNTYAYADFLTLTGQSAVFDRPFCSNLVLTRTVLCNHNISLSHKPVKTNLAPCSTFILRNLRQRTDASGACILLSCMVEEVRLNHPALQIGTPAKDCSSQTRSPVGANTESIEPLRAGKTADWFYEGDSKFSATSRISLSGFLAKAARLMRIPCLGMASR